MSSIGEILWVEKYRPKSLSDIINQKEIVERLKKFVSEKNMPHLLFAGPAGTGKCVTRDTPILTWEGVRTIGEIVEGSLGNGRAGLGFKPARIGVYSLGPRGSIARSVTSHVFKGVSSRTVRIELDGGKFVETTPEHPLLVLGPSGAPEWLPAEDVRAGYYVAAPRMIPVGGLQEYPKLEALASLAGILEALAGQESGGIYCGDRQAISLASALLAKAISPKYRRVPSAAGDSCIEIPSRVAGTIYRALGAKDGGPGRGVPPLLWRSTSGLTAYARSLIGASREIGGIHGVWVKRGKAAIEISYALEALGLRTTLKRDGKATIVSWTGEDYDAPEDWGSRWIRWERVSRVTVSKGDKVVYDLTVPGYENFIGGHGPLVLHNTTAAHALAHDLYGENYRQYVLELNASVSKDTPILVRLWGLTLRTTFGELDRLYFGSGDFVRLGTGEYARAEGLEVLTYDVESGRVAWASATWIIRHRAGKILRVRVKGGGELGLTGNHSVMVLDDDGRLVERSASDIRPGDYLVSFTALLHDSESLADPGARAKQGDYMERSPALLSVAVTRAGGETGSSTLVSSGYAGAHPGTQSLERLDEGLFFKGQPRRVPPRIYSAPPAHRLAYLKSLNTREDGEWRLVPASSRDFVIDVAWLARITGVASLLGGKSARIGWDGESQGPLPSRPFAKFLREARYAARKASESMAWLTILESRKTVSKEEALKALSSIDESRLRKDHRLVMERLRRLVFSDIHVLEVEHVELVDYNDYVYDVSVPGGSMFFAGAVPVLLHNSDERGINVIREKVKEFARSRSPAGIPFKIVILDEADNMTSDAQQALRRLMELFSASTRFILIANYPSKIIDPIQSRCAYFRFQPLKKEDIVERLRYIAENENVEYDEEALDTIYEISEGDMRKAINILQSSAALGKVTVESVFRVVGMAKPKEIRDMIKLALSGDFTSARTMLRKLMIEYGLSGEDVVRQIHKEVMGPDIKISDDLRVLISDYLGEIHYRMVEGSDEDIQLSAFLAWLAMIGKKVGGKG